MDLPFMTTHHHLITLLADRWTRHELQLTIMKSRVMFLGIALAPGFLCTITATARIFP
jgi:hypothetical protein